MSAQALSVVTLIVPNAEWHVSGHDDQPVLLSSALSFTFNTSFDIRTVSSRGASSGGDVTGLLYVPTLAATSACVNASEPYIPAAVTRRVNLPPDDYNLVALAPWVSGECSLEYMEAARRDPTKAILFFVPGLPGIPPDADDAQWDISSAQNWKATNGFPVYAVNAANGALLLRASAMYSGNMTDVPHGHMLTGYYASRDYVRLHVDIDTGNRRSLPSLWVILLVIVGFLLAIIGSASFGMHLLRRHRRKTLRRRVQSGHVDLEAVGIKRLTVPRAVLDAMPLCQYGKTHSAIEKEVVSTQIVSSRLAALVPTSTSYHPDALLQPTCAICLDDFVPFTTEQEGTIVRELPCHHLFHPECVDAFLRESSSLCPMCKKTVLPAGYCPRIITNVMVRRERLLRQTRERVAADSDSSDSAFPYTVRDRLQSMPGVRQFRASRRRQQITPLDSDTVRGHATPTAPLSLDLDRSQIQPHATADHRGGGPRQRAEYMLGRLAPDDPEAEDTKTTAA